MVSALAFPGAEEHGAELPAVIHLLPPEARVALTLLEAGGLTAEEIARAFLIAPRTVARRIVRAKAKIRDTPIRYEVPSPREIPERLNAVLQVIYLLLNEGYSAAAGSEITRAELIAEAIRLGRLLRELLPEPEVTGLFSLVLVQESRHAARTSPTGELILLENQDRSLWNRQQIGEGVALMEQSPIVELNRAVAMRDGPGSVCL